MSQWNSIPSYTEDSYYKLQESAGITQFQGTDSWFQVENGRIVQGGTTTTIPAGGSLIVNFPAPYEKQVLGVLLTPISATPNTFSLNPAGLNLTQFQIVNGAAAAASFFWKSEGV